MKTFIAGLVTVTVLSVLAWHFVIGPKFVQSMKPPASQTVTIPNPIPEPGSALDELRKSAKEHGYYFYMRDVAVPYDAFPAARMSEWKRISEEERHLPVVAPPTRIQVEFDQNGREICGVSIIWGQHNSTSFYWHLSGEQTMDFVVKAIREMEERDNLKKGA